MAETPICPILSVRHPEIDSICLTTDCALYLPSAKKCSLVYIGFKAMMDVQQMTGPMQTHGQPQGQPPQAPPQQRPPQQQQMPQQPQMPPQARPAQ